MECPPEFDVFWFDRGQKVHDKTAKIITKYINSIRYESVDVIFHSLEESKYIMKMGNIFRGKINLVLNNI